MVNNVKVYCRFRPQNASERALNGQPCHEVLDEQSVQLLPAGAAASGALPTPSGGFGDPFTFDHVFDVDSTQQEVYESVGRDLVAQCLDGYHCTCFAYGQTGAGKTHTMMGSRTDEHEAGIIPRVVADIFSHINAASADDEFTVKASYVEIYLERIRDLLRPVISNATPGKQRAGGAGGGGVDEFNSQNLRIRHDKNGRGLYVCLLHDVELCAVP
jgi:kinesin family protein 5